MNDQFDQLEDKYLRLKGQLAAGRITRQQFEATLKDMMIQDAQGRYWILGVDDAKWYVHNGMAWAQAQPPSTEPLAQKSRPKENSQTNLDNSPFLMRIGGVFHIAGNVVATGRIERGTVRPGDRVELIGNGKAYPTTVARIESFNKVLREARAGQDVGIALKEQTVDVIREGMLIAAEGTFKGDTHTTK